MTYEQKIWYRNIQSLCKKRLTKCSNLNVKREKKSLMQLSAKIPPFLLSPPFLPRSPFMFKRRLFNYRARSNSSRRVYSTLSAAAAAGSRQKGKEGKCSTSPSFLYCMFPHPWLVRNICPVMVHAPAATLSNAARVMY